MSGRGRLSPREAEPHHPAPRRHLIERNDLCINCGMCATTCIYDCHRRSDDDPRKMADPRPDCCRNCFACILRCPRSALTMRLNPAHAAIGDQKVYTPAVIVSLQDQAANGKVPVSGAGYGGPFSGEGFDNIWTDMSEIVRPTRDGIHGREHISTTVNLGRRITDLNGLAFDQSGSLRSLIPPSREIPIPILFGPPPFPVPQPAILAAALAASQLQTFVTLPVAQLEEMLGQPPQQIMEFFNHLVLRLSAEEIEAHRRSLTWASMVEVEPGPDQLEAIDRIRRINPQLITILRVPASAGAGSRIVELARDGAEIIHLSADMQGAGDDGSSMIDVLSRAQRLLVDEGLRDLVTLLASGGIAMAEHVPKTIILGADAVFIDVPVLAAMECVVCAECESGGACPVNLGAVDETWGQVAGSKPFHKWGATRIINLMLAWRDQLLEVLGAMGMRDVRRLRGERGRAVFSDRARVDFLRRIGHEPAPAMNAIGRTVADTGYFANVDQLGPSGGAAQRRFPVLPGDWLVAVDRKQCVDCGICADSCRYGVHRRIDGKAALEEPLHGKCIGPSCLDRNEWCCVKVCPWDAISIKPSSLDEVLGDRRWTAAVLKETYRQARTGLPNDEEQGLTGGSGGGFDALRLRLNHGRAGIDPSGVDLSIPLNRRGDGRPEITIPFPWYGGGMSYGSISLQVMVGRAMAAAEMGTFTSTGEGGYPDELAPYGDHVITQVATGLFGVREETILRARLVEFKYAQGAKPGLGGHLLGEKNTPDVSRMREAVQGTGLFSPFPFHSVYSVEDHKKHVDWIRSIHPEALVSVKVSTPADVDMVAVGSYYAGANIVNLDGAYGGTGAAPDIAKKNIAMPIEYAIAQVHDFLVAEGIRDRIVLISGGGIRTPDDVLKAVAIGADGVAIGTAELVAIDCVRCGNCERNRGCPLGIATTDRELASQLDSEWVCRRIVNMYSAWAAQMRRRLASMGLSSVVELRGRRDLLAYVGTP